MPRRLVARALAVCVVGGVLAVGSVVPARANHVLQPACDIFRQTLISAQTAFTNSDTPYLAAVGTTATAAFNLATAANQFVAPTVNLIVAHENQTGIAPAEATFNSAQSFFNSAIVNYVNALTRETELKATRDLNAAVIPYLQGVIAALDGLPNFSCPGFGDG